MLNPPRNQTGAWGNPSGYLKTAYEVPLAEADEIGELGEFYRLRQMVCDEIVDVYELWDPQRRHMLTPQRLSGVAGSPPDLVGHHGRERIQHGGCMATLADRRAHPL